MNGKAIMAARFILPLGDDYGWRPRFAFVTRTREATRSDFLALTVAEEHADPAVGEPLERRRHRIETSVGRRDDDTFGRRGTTFTIQRQRDERCAVIVASPGMTGVSEKNRAIFKRDQASFAFPRDRVRGRRHVEQRKRIVDARRHHRR